MCIFGTVDKAKQRFCKVTKINIREQDLNVVFNTDTSFALITFLAVALISSYDGI